MAKNTVHCPVCGGIMRTKYSKRGDKHTCLDTDCAFMYTTGGKRRNVRSMRAQRGRKQAHFKEYM